MEDHMSFPFPPPRNHCEEIANARALHEQATPLRDASDDLIATAPLPSHRRTPAELAQIAKDNDLCRRFGERARAKTLTPAAVQ
jgi:hypothetical protein